MCLVHPGRGYCVQICAQHTRAGIPSTVADQLSEGRWMVLISWERWQLLHLQGGTDQRLVRLCRPGLLSIPAAPITEILLPLGSELWIPPFTPVCSTDSI